MPGYSIYIFFFFEMFFLCFCYRIEKLFDSKLNESIDVMNKYCVEEDKDFQVEKSLHFWNVEMLDI